MTHRYMDHRIHRFLFGSELAFHLNRSRGSTSESLHYRVSLVRVKIILHHVGQNAAPARRPYDATCRRSFVHRCRPDRVYMFHHVSHFTMSLYRVE